MPHQTHILGKDAPLEETIGNARELLNRHGFPIELVSVKNPVRNCWSVHLRSNDAPQLFTNGKGGSRLASEASAILEFFERVSTNLFFTDFYLGKSEETDDFLFYPQEKWFPVADPAVIPIHHPDGTELLNEALRNYYDPDGELTPDLLHDNNSDPTGRGIVTLPFEHIGSQETVYFPVSILTNMYASNGMAAGNTTTECRAQALAEIIERYVKKRIITEGICLPDVPQEVLSRYPKIQKDIEELREHGFPILVKDASLDGQFPVICVLLISPEDGGCYASFGASCRFEVALERTVTELLQGRGLDQLNIFECPSHDIDSVSDILNIESHFINSVGLLSWKMFGDQPDYAFNDWDFQGSTSDEYDHLAAIVHANNFEAYCAEYSHCGIYTCRIIVPGMSDIYPVDDLIWGNKVTGASLRGQLLKLDALSIDEVNEFSEQLDKLALSDELPITEAIGVIFEEGTAWSSLCIGELKAMLALATENVEEASHWCSWCNNFGHLPPDRQTLYRAIHTLLEFDRTDEKQSDYYTSLNLFFDEQVVRDAIDIVAGRKTFSGLTFAKSWEEVSPAHQTFINVYKRLHPLKAAK